MTWNFFFYSKRSNKISAFIERSIKIAIFDIWSENDKNWFLVFIYRVALLQWNPFSSHAPVKLKIKMSFDSHLSDELNSVIPFVYDQSALSPTSEKHQEKVSLNMCLKQEKFEWRDVDDSFNIQNVLESINHWINCELKISAQFFSHSNYNDEKVRRINFKVWIQIRWLFSI